MGNLFTVRTKDKTLVEPLKGNKRDFERSRIKCGKFSRKLLYTEIVDTLFVEVSEITRKVRKYRSAK